MSVASPGYGVEANAAVARESYARWAPSGEGSEMNVQTTGITRDSESQATEIVDTKPLGISPLSGTEKWLSQTPWSQVRRCRMILLAQVLV